MAASGADGNICLLKQASSAALSSSALSLDIAHAVLYVAHDDDDHCFCGVHDYDLRQTPTTLHPFLCQRLILSIIRIGARSPAHLVPLLSSHPPPLVSFVHTAS